MILRELFLKNFRNLNLKLVPQAGLNLIIGNNGSGKSNLLDAIYHLALAKSFKPYSLKNNININKPTDFSIISGRIESNDLPKDLRIVFSHSGENMERKRHEVNTKATTRAKFIANLDVILFAPHNINMIVGTPQVRRDEFDDFAAICDFKYALAFEQYTTVIKNRNRLLKAINENLATTNQLTYWNEKLVKLGSFLTCERQRIISELKPVIEEYAHAYLKPELQNFSLEYLSKFTVDEITGTNSLAEITNRFQHKLEQNQIKEIAAKQTLYGPQKDDYCFILNGKLDLKTFGSRGQQRMVILVMKLAMWQYLYRNKKVKPLILLDDIMSELDEEHKKILESIVKNLDSQTFITTTHEKDYSPKLRKLMTVTKLEQ